MASPSSRRATKRRRSSITELAFHGIHTSRLQKSKKCNPCIRYEMSPMSLAAQPRRKTRQNKAFCRPAFWPVSGLENGRAAALSRRLRVGGLRGLPKNQSIREIQGGARMKGSDVLVAAPENGRVDRRYGVPGEENLDVVESLGQSSIELIAPHHNQPAAFMAATYGRL